MGFNRRKMEDQRRGLAEQEAAARRATDAQVLEDAERLIAAWNERQAQRMPMLFSPTIGAAIVARHWYLWVHCRRRARAQCGMPQMASSQCLAFGGSYSNVEIAAVANYVTGRFGSEQSRVTAEDAAQLRKQTSR